MGDIAMVTKLAAANRQLSTAIRMFFADDDAVSVHTLACAAREIYENHCGQAGQHRMFDFVRAGNPRYADRDLRNLLNAARNFFKHPGNSLGEQIEFNDSMNDFQLLSACIDCETLCTPHQPPEVQAYSLWFVATEQPDEGAMVSADPTEADLVRRMQTEIDRRYPGLRTASRQEKKRFGRQLLTDALAGRLVERTDEPSEGDVEIGPNVYVAGS